MGKSGKVLIAGESWVTHSIHQKGFDSFTTTSYEEGVGPLRAALGGKPRRGLTQFAELRRIDKAAHRYGTGQFARG